MMRFIKQGNAYKVVKVSGPLRNYLSVVFGENSPTGGPEIVATNLNSEEPNQLVPEQVKLQVEAGIVAANSEFGCSYFPETISYIGSDSLPDEIYYELAFSIIRHLSANGRFEEVVI